MADAKNSSQPTIAPVGPSARYFEDFSLGDTFTTQGRTITQTDAVLWSMFTGDMNPIHVDESFAAAYSVFGGTVPQGLLSVAVASGLQDRLGLFDGTGRAMLGQTIRYRAAVRVGDTVKVELTVRELLRRSRPGVGEVRFDLIIRVIERDEVAIEGTLDILCGCRDAVS